MTLAVSEQFAQLLGFGPADIDVPAPASLIGLEHEFVVRDGARVLDFRTIIGGLEFGGQRLDPGDINAQRCPWGGVVTADGPEAEIATPPIAIERGFVAALEAEAGIGAAALTQALPDGLKLDGYSTHLSVAAPDALGPSLCDEFAQRFAPGLMLLADRADSPGLLVRPRPGRVEAAFEFATGDPLRGAATYFAGAVRALLDGSPLPPALRVDKVATADRVGWGLRRDAFGDDLLNGGRQARLHANAGYELDAQQHLEISWDVARSALRDRVDDNDLDAADRLVAGDSLLPLEGTSAFAAVTPHVASQSPFGALLETVARPSFHVDAHTATWDLTIFSLRGAQRNGFAVVPRGALPRFVDLFRGGALDAVVESFLRTQSSERVVSGWGEARRPGLFDELGPLTAFIAPEATYGTTSGGGSTPAERYGKYDTGRTEEPPGQPEPPRPRTALIVGIVVALIVTLIGGGIVLQRDEPGIVERPQPTTTISTEPGRPDESTTSTSTALVSGPYEGTVVVDEDPAGHKCCVFPATLWEVLQVRDTATGQITITLGSVLNAITLTGPLAGTGAAFEATGTGTVAGRPGTQVVFRGTVTPLGGLHGTLTVGGNGTLPTGRPITFRVDMAKVT